MSGLRERLRRLKRSVQQDTQPAAMEAETAGGIGSPEDREAAEWARLAAEIVHMEGGSFIRRIRKFPLALRHGHVQLAELQLIDQRLAELGSPYRELASPKHLLFLDTETTGLGVGTGNVPFMVGYGYLQDDEFVVEQLFIRNPAEEYGALSYLHRLLGQYSHIITYNGRSFDWPVLLNRFVLQRLEAPQDHAQIDLLYPARSLWRYSLPSCRLGVIEERKLGYRRGPDLPGAEAPVRYLQYLSTLRVEDVEEIFLHNERDILTLAGLTVLFQQLISGSSEAASRILEEDGIKVASWLDKLGHRARAREALSEALHYETITRPQLLEAAALWKRWREYDRAAVLWKIYCRKSAGTLHAIEPMIELAIFYEHRARDVEQALAWADRARELLLRRLSLRRRSASDREMLRQLDHRIARLHRKIDKPAQELLQFR